MQELVDATKQQHAIEQEIKGLFTNGGGPSFATVTASDPSHSFAGGGPGDVFVKSAAHQRIAAGDRGQTWTTGPVEVSSGRLLTKGTLLETGAGGPGGGLVPPGYQPGVVEKLFEPLGVADVFATSNVTASQVRYVVEGTATNAAAGVAEAGLKPESTIALSETTEAIRKLRPSSRCPTNFSRMRRRCSST